MGRALLVLAGLASVAAAGRAKDDGSHLTRYDSKAGRFTVVLPKRPKVDAKTVRTAAGDLTVTTESATDDGLQLSVTWTDYPPSFGRLDSGKLLDAVRDGMRAKGSTLILSGGQPGKDDGSTVPYPGREFTYDHGKTIARTRAFLVGTRLYQVTASGPREAVHTQTTQRFLESFEVTDR